MEKLISEILNR